MGGGGVSGTRHGDPNVNFLVYVWHLQYGVNNYQYKASRGYNVC